MKRSWAMFVVLALVCGLTPALMPQDAFGVYGWGKRQCVYLKAGQLIKSGECWFYEITSGGVTTSGTCFTDRVGSAGECENGGNGFRYYSDKGYYGDTGTEEISIDDKPAVEQEKPVMGKGWSCYEVRGMQEVMCMSENNICTSVSSRN